ncbi:hypothetical protein FRV13_03180 [Escherichia coli]|uniref:hypothetical protein n=1 Tax=Escherichia coli TaxID=562 RepID=UPI00063D30FB|nr:hypothetical protein [Escherichia coli]EEX9088828.1 hypothetical protein [Escherichia coli]EEY1040919.1 hypothetical protein [Escherichia coli]EEY1044124.1 hypothetical protein [Escherichia coli]EEY3142924.1 hypothetical protein [Escherichia coli]EFJ8818284.1 hypothetical protein [Escherichia coli]
MIDIHAELNEYKKDFISLREFLEVVLKVAGDDYDVSDVITWILRRISGEHIRLYTVNEFKLLESFCNPYRDEFDYDVLYRNLNAVRKRGCLPGERDENGFLVSGFWEDPEFENIGFIRGEIFAIFPDVLDALTKLEGANSSENDEAQGRDIEKKELRTEDDLLSQIAMLEKENAELRARIEQLEQERPIHLYKYWDKDPLAKAIEIRNREWANYDPENDFATRGNQEAITRELKQWGASNALATLIERTACPINRDNSQKNAKPD